MTSTYNDAVPLINRLLDILPSPAINPNTIARTIAPSVTLKVIRMPSGTNLKIAIYWSGRPKARKRQSTIEPKKAMRQAVKSPVSLL